MVLSIFYWFVLAHHLVSLCALSVDVCDTSVCAKDQICENLMKPSPPPPYTCSCHPGFVMVDGDCVGKWFLFLCVKHLWNS